MCRIESKTKMSQRDILLTLQEFHGSVAAFHTDGNVYEACTRAAYTKSFEFALFAHDESQNESAFYWIPILRTVCEDLIILYHLSKFSVADREELMSKIQLHELHTRMSVQGKFFTRVRPQQRVPDSDTDLADLENQIREVWRRNGWPNMNRGVLPPTLQMAEKSGGDILGSLYDYLFRLTSSTVHFSVHGLLRTGWGELPNVTFSPSNFSKYFSEFGRVYGVYMYCCYTELFGDMFELDEETKSRTDELRQSLLRTPRWPEMVTYEEIGMQPPEYTIGKRVVAHLRSEWTDRLLDL